MTATIEMAMVFKFLYVTEERRNGKRILFNPCEALLCSRVKMWSARIATNGTARKSLNIQSLSTLNGTRTMRNFTIR